VKWHDNKKEQRRLKLSVSAKESGRRLKIEGKWCRVAGGGAHLL
jgi:hypothetical protein